MSPQPPSPPGGFVRRAIFVAVTALATPSTAQTAGDGDLTELDLEALMRIEVREVVGASKHAQRANEAPSSVTVVTRAEIRARGYRSLDQILRGLGGVYATYDRNYRHVGVRGFYLPGDYDSRILVVVDGHRMNENVYGSANIGLESAIDVDLIERLEFIRGPGSALYGSNAFLAVVNIVTRRGSDIAGFEGAAEAGSGESYLARTTFGERTESGVDYVVSASGFDSAGERLEFDAFAGSTPSNGVTRDTDYERAYHLFGRVDLGEVEVSSGYAWREKGIPTASYDTVFDEPANRTIDARVFLDALWQREIAAGRELSLRAHFDDYDYRGWYIYDTTSSGGPPDLANHDAGRGRWIGVDAQLVLDDDGDQRWTLGSEVRWNVDQDQTNEDATAEYLDDHRQGVDYALFVQDEIALSSELALIAGVRWDEYTNFGGALAPRLGLVWRPDEADAWKLLYGQAFRAPNAYELYYRDGYSQKSNPDLHAETIETYEAVYERYFDTSLRTSVSVYHYEIENLILQVLDPADDLLVFTNAADVHANGIELEVERLFAGGVRALVSQSFQRAEDTSMGDDVVNSPRHVTQVHLSAPLFGSKWAAELEVLGVGSRDTVSGGSVDAYWLANLNILGRELAPGVEVALGITNLFDARYEDPAGAEIAFDAVEQDGRGGFVRLTVRR